MSEERAQTDEAIREIAEEAVEAKREAEASRVFVVGELNVTNPDRRLLVLSVPKTIDLDNRRQVSDLVVAVADAMERRSDEA